MPVWAAGWAVGADVAVVCGAVGGGAVGWAAGLVAAGAAVGCTAVAAGWAGAAVAAGLVAAGAVVGAGVGLVLHADSSVVNTLAATVSIKCLFFIVFKLQILM